MTSRFLSGLASGPATPSAHGAHLHAAALPHSPRVQAGFSTLGAGRREHPVFLGIATQLPIAIPWPYFLEEAKGIHSREVQTCKLLRRRVGFGAWKAH